MTPKSLFSTRLLKKNHSSFDKAQDERVSTKFYTQEIPFVVSLDIHHTSLSMNGILSIISNLFPFVLSPSKDSERVFQIKDFSLFKSFAQALLIDAPGHSFILDPAALLFQNQSRSPSRYGKTLDAPLRFLPA